MPELCITQLDYKDLIRHFLYDYTTGLMYRKKSGGGAIIGGEITTKGNHGYKYVSHKYKKLSFARVAWTLFHGRQPKKCIDHIDGDRLNNKIENLREATKYQNSCNRLPVKGRKLPTGVINNGKKYSARIIIDGDYFHLGTFNSIEEASEIYVQEKHNRDKKVWSKK